MRHKLQTQEKLESVKIGLSTLSTSINHSSLSATEVIKRLKVLENQVENALSLIGLE